MITVDFPGSRKLIDAIDASVVQPDTPAITDTLRNALCRLIRSQEVILPACVFESTGDHYARRELYRSDEHGYSVVAMTWGPGQGTLIHDHSGMWCVEGVWNGALEIVQYELLGHEAERYQFRAVGSIQAGPGSAGSLIPPHEYHSIRNASPDAVAISLHIYKAPMECCSMFLPQDGEWYYRAPRELATDEAA